MSAQTSALNPIIRACEAGAVWVKAAATSPEGAGSSASASYAANASSRVSRPRFRLVRFRSNVAPLVCRLFAETYSDLARRCVSAVRGARSSPFPEKRRTRHISSIINANFSVDERI